MRSSRLRVAPVAIPVVLWSLSLFHFAESHLSLYRHYLCNNYTLYYDIWLSVITFCRMCGTIDPGSCIRWVLSFDIKTGYDIAAAYGGGICCCSQHIATGEKRRDKHVQERGKWKGVSGCGSRKHTICVGVFLCCWLVEESMCGSRERESEVQL
jgi:hypothetical protein